MTPTFKTRLRTLPAGPEHSFSFNQLLQQIYYLALVLHVGFGVVFGFLGLWGLALLNGASIAAYTAVLGLNHGRYWSPALLAVCVEVVLHAVVATVALGWQAGFQYYLFAVAPVVLLNTHWTLGFRLALVGLVILIISALHVYSGGVAQAAPVFALAPEALGLLHLGNAVAVNITLGFIVYRYGAMAKRAEHTLTAATVEWERKAHLDVLTGIYNRRAMETLLKQEASRSDRHAACFALAIVDIDDFKAINDSHGHDVGDAVIRHVAGTIRGGIRSHDAVGRWGGEEFLVLLTQVEPCVIGSVLETLRARIVSASLDHPSVPDYSVTIGAATFQPGDRIDAVLKRADDALYRGKRHGKNRVEVASI